MSRRHPAQPPPFRLASSWQAGDRSRAWNELWRRLLADIAAEARCDAQPTAESASTTDAGPPSSASDDDCLDG